MAAPKGHPRYGGRVKGVPNRKTQSLLDKCEEMGIDLFQSLLELTKSDDPHLKLSALKEACQYVYPKRKSLEHSGSLDPKMMEAAENVADMSKEEQIQLLESEIKRLKE